jgi:carbamoyl-phosphate synthase large subunit
MLSGQIQLVVNTTEGAQAVSDSFSIRRSALTHSICHFTTLAGALAAVDAIGTLQRGALDVAPLQSYLTGSF